MDRFWDYVKSTCVNFKLDSCCCIAPITTGLLVIGYFNIFISLLTLVGTADDGYIIYTPPLMAVQAAILEDDPSKPLGIVAYATEMAFNMLLLSGIYRNDITLLRVYIYFLIASIISSVLVYSIVFIRISTLTKTLIIWILVFHCYEIVLVRSVMVEINQARASEKNGHVTLYSVVRMPDDVPVKADEILEPEVTVEPQTSEKEEHKKNEEGPHIEQKKEETPSKLETVHEQLKQKKGEPSSKVETVNELLKHKKEEALPKLETVNEQSKEN